MTSHSIFSRQWWAVSLRATRLPATPLRQRLEKIASQIADGVGGKLQIKPTATKPGVVIALADEQNGFATIATVVLLQTEKIYFPLAEDELESGPVAFDAMDRCERDFPRRLKSGKTL